MNLIITVEITYNLCKWCKRWQSYLGPWTSNDEAWFFVRIKFLGSEDITVSLLVCCRTNSSYGCQ
jgi:hypothetical protein